MPETLTSIPPEEQPSNKTNNIEEKKANNEAKNIVLHKQIIDDLKSTYNQINVATNQEKVIHDIINKHDSAKDYPNFTEESKKKFLTDIMKEFTINQMKQVNEIQKNTNNI